MTSPAQGQLPAPVGDYARLQFPEATADRPYTILNMVSSADGKAVAGSTETSISSTRDKLVLQSLRVHADAILNGMGTARATGVNPSIRNFGLRELRRKLGRPEPPLQVLFTRGGSIPLNAPFFREAAFRRALFIAAESEPDGVEALRGSGTSVQLVTPGAEAVPAMLASLLHDFSVRLLLIEGGPELNASLFHAQAIDEFFLTLGPHIVGGRDTITPVEGDPFGAPRMPQLELVSAVPIAETSEVYLHWRVRYAPL